jgi:pyruvate formate lyase activating enzyme
MLSNAERELLEEVKGIVFDVQRYSLHDGPGLRTSVFLKGCPLHCKWCSNPESQRFGPELLLFSANCLLCGTCVEVCAVGARTVVGEELVWDRRFCTSCGACVNVCPLRAMTQSGHRQKAGEVIEQVLRDVAFYQDGGGLTLSGGEPLAQPAFAEALLRLAKAENLNTALETTGHAPWEVLERLLPYVDLWLYDVKHLDSEAHREHTGLGNELILSNLRRLASLQAPIALRLPLIPGFNMAEDNLRRTAILAMELGGAVCSIDLLPYHGLARAKYAALGRTYLWGDHDPPTAEDVDAVAAIFYSHGLDVQKSTGWNLDKAAQDDIIRCTVHELA